MFRAEDWVSLWGEGVCKVFKSNMHEYDETRMSMEDTCARGKAPLYQFVQEGL